MRARLSSPSNRKPSCFATRDLQPGREGAWVRVRVLGVRV